MNRRDTVIVAVVLNAGLLMVLFATSLKSPQAKGEPPMVQVLEPRQSHISQGRATAAPKEPFLPVDPIDQIVQQYVAPQIVSSVEGVSATSSEVLSGNVSAVIAGADLLQKDVSSAALKEIKVKKGDVLEKIAKEHRVSVHELMKANGLVSSRLKIGQSLKIPAKKESKNSVAQREGQFYTVKAGDTPWTIAVKHRMKVEELLQLNGIDETKARRLQPGDQVRIQ